MTRAIHRRTGPTRALSTLLAVVFALSVVGVGLTTVTLAEDPNPSTEETQAPVASSEGSDDPGEAVEPEPEAEPSEEPPAAPSDEPTETADPVDPPPEQPDKAPAATVGDGSSVEVGPLTVAPEATLFVAPVVAGVGGSAKFVHEGYRIGTGWKPANLGKDYHEGDWVPMRFYIDNSNGATPYTYNDLTLIADHFLQSGSKSGVGVDETRNWHILNTSVEPTLGDNPSAPGGATPVAPDTKDLPSLDMAGTPGTFGSAPYIVSIFNSVVAPAGQYTIIYYEAHMSVTQWWLQQSTPRNGSSHYPGSSLQMRVESPSGDRTVTIPLPPEPTGKIEVLKFNDLDGSGKKDDGEPWLDDWNFTLNGGPVGYPFELTGTTDASGSIVFSDLPNGDYTATETLQDGWVNTTPLSQDASINARSDNKADYEKTLLFGNTPATYGIEGLKWEDLDGDGEKGTSEPLLPGWTIELSMKVGGVWQSYDTTVTGPDGHYAFTGLPAGDYKVEEVLKDGWVQTFGGHEFTLPAAEPGSYDFGNQEIAHKAFQLTLDHAIPDTEDVSFYAVTTIGGVPTTFTLDPDSGTAFSSDSVTLPVGTEIGWTTWYADWDGETGIWLGEKEGEILSQDTTNTYHYGATVDGIKFDDTPAAAFLDPTGQYEAGEALLDGWEITLYRQVGDSWVAYDTTMTANGGQYKFYGVLPGWYSALETQQTGWSQTGGPTSLGDDPFYVDPVEFQGPDHEGPDFGNTQIYKGFKFTFLGDLASVPGTAPAFWVRFGADYPDNGIGSVDETVTIPLMNGANPYTADAQRIPIGTVLSGIEWLAMYAGEELLVDYDAGPETIQEDTLNEGSFQPEVFGFKWLDSNGDGQIGSEPETQAAGWTIVLERWDGDSFEPYDSQATAFKNAGNPGYFTFTNVMPGIYRISEVGQAGYVMTAGPVGAGLVNGAFEVTWDDAWWGNIAFLNAPVVQKTFELTLDASVPATDPVNFYVETTVDSVPATFTLAGGPSVYTSDVMTFVAGTTIGSVDWLADWDGATGILLGTTSGETLLDRETKNEFSYGNSLYAYKYIDLDGNGSQNGQESGEPGWEMNLYRQVGGDWVPYGDPAVTSGSGVATFTGLLPGVYSVLETSKSGYAQTDGPTEKGDEFVLIPGGQEVPVMFGNAPMVDKDFELTLEDPIPDTEAVSFYAVTTIAGEPATFTLSASSETTFSSETTTVVSGTVIGDVYWYADWDGATGILLGVTQGETLTESMKNSYHYDAYVSGIKYDDTPEEPFTTPNGQYDAGEALLAGWEITLYRQVGDAWVAYDTTTTASDGHYTFYGVLPGWYSAVETLQPGWAQSGGPKNVGDDPFYVNPVEFQGPDHDGPDFGNFQVFKGFQFTFDGDMPNPAPSFWVSYEADYPDNGIGSVDLTATIPLLNGSNPYTADAVKLPVGTVLTNVEWKALWMNEWIVLDTDAGPEVIDVDTLNEGDYDAWFDADKFEDVVHDSTWVEADGEDGLEGWVIELYRWTNPERDALTIDGGQLFSTPAVFGPGWVLYDADITDVNGHVSFSGLLPGTYFSRELTRTGWAQTAGPGAYGTDPSLVTFDVSKGTSATAEFGNRQPIKTFDLMFTGTVPEADSFWVEYGVTGPTPEEPDLVFEYAFIATGTLEPYDAGDEKNHFRLVDDYRAVGEVIGPVYWYARYGGEDLLLGITEGETLGADDVTNPFEYGSQVYGHKWDDSGPIDFGGENGVWDEGEPGIPNWTIELYRQNPDTSWSLYRTGETDADGAYFFDNVLPGTYYLAEVIPDLGGLAEWIQSAGPSGVGDGEFFIFNGGEQEQNLEHGPVDFGNFTRLIFEDLALDKAGDETFVAGEIVDYTLTYWVTSGGPFSGPDFYIEDDYDERYISEVVDANGGVVSDGKIRWDLNLKHPAGLAIEDGVQTLTYKVRVAEDIPDDVTEIDNFALIDHPLDADPTNNDGDHRTKRPLPFLPFTGGSLAMLLVAALIAAVAGMIFRRLGGVAQG